MTKSPSSHILPELPITRKIFPTNREVFQALDPRPNQSSLPSSSKPASPAENPSPESEVRPAVSSAIRDVVGRTPVAPTLSILRGLKAGRIYELLGESISIGRNSHSDLVLPDEVVSRDHAMLRAREDGFYIEDLRSRNGTFVNGKRIDQPTKLKNGDYIQVYELLLSFHDQVANASARPVDVQKDLADWSAEDSNMEIPGNRNPLVQRTRRRSRSSAIIMTLDASWTGPERVEVNAETKLQAVLEITRNLGSTLDLDHVLSRILDSVFRFFPQADHGYILKSEAKGGLRPAVIKHRERGGAAEYDPSDCPHDCQAGFVRSQGDFKFRRDLRPTIAGDADLGFGERAPFDDVRSFDGPLANALGDYLHRHRRFRQPVWGR